MASRLPARLSVLGLILAVASVAVLWLPSVSSETVATEDPNQPPVVMEERLSLIATEGWTVLIPVLVPVLIAFVPVAFRRRRVAQASRVAAAGLVGIGVLLAMASIGMLFVPTLGVLIAAAVTGELEVRPSA
jgi:hypothetical protein